MNKIALLTADIKTESGRGIAVYTKELAEGLAKAGLNIDIVHYPLGSLKSLIQLIPLLKRYDTIHIQHEYNLFGSFAGVKFIPFLILLSLSAHSRLVITMHTIHGKKEKLIHKSALWLWIRSHIVYPLENKIIGRLCDKIIVHTKFLADRLVKDYKIDNHKIEIIPHGVRENPPIINKNKAKKKLGLKGPVYLMIGNISFQKGFDIILKEAKKIGKTIIIFGQALGISSEIYTKSLEEFVIKNKLREIVRIDTKIDSVESDYKKWWLYLSAADLMLLPYRSMTTSGIFISAMQANKPVVSSNTDYFREIASKYKCIKIVENEGNYSSAIKECMKNLRFMECEAKRFSEKNSFSVLSKRYESVYSHVPHNS